MAFPKYYNRVGYVTLNEGNDVAGEFRGLNFKFTCEYAGSPTIGRAAKASVGILGLTADMVYEWASFCNGTNEHSYAVLMGSKIRTVSVYAGYEHSFTESPLFVLPVIGAWPTSPPDMWLNIHAYNTTEFNSHFYTVTLNPPLSARPHDPKYFFNSKQVCEKVAETIGARLRWDGGTKMGELREFESVNWSGTVSDLLAKINESAVLYAHIEFGSPDIEVPTLVVSRHSREDADNLKMFSGMTKVKPPAQISAETGMIGLPKLSAGNGRAGQIEVTTLLRNDLDIGDQIKVKSEYVRRANDTFTITKIKHEGEFRGNGWQTTFTGIPSDVYGKKSETAKGGNGGQ